MISSPLRQYRTTVLLLLTLSFLVTSIGRLMFGPLVPFIVDDFGISNSIVGLVLTGMWFTFALIQFPSGVLAERFGGKPLVLVSVGGSALLAALSAVAPVFALFAAGVFLIGAITGLHYSVATSMLSQVYDETGKALGIHAAGAPLAGLLTPIVATWIAVTYHWRVAVLFAAVVGAPVFGLVISHVHHREPRRPDQPMRERFQLQSVLELLTRPSIGFTLVLAAVTTFVIQGLYSFIPQFLVKFRGIDPTVSSVLFSTFFVVTVPGQIGLGKLSDVYGRDTTVAGSMLVAIAGIGLLVFGPGVLGALAGVVLLGVGTHCLPVVQARIYDNLSVEEESSGFGLARTSYLIPASLGSVTVGVLVDVLGWQPAFGVLGGLLGLVFGMIALNALANDRY